MNGALERQVAQAIPLSVHTQTLAVGVSRVILPIPTQDHGRTNPSYPDELTTPLPERDPRLQITGGYDPPTVRPPTFRALDRKGIPSVGSPPNTRLAAPSTT